MPSARFAITRRQTWALGLAVACAVGPPALSRMAPGVFEASKAGDLAYGGIWAAMAISLNLLMGYAGQISLGHGALVGVGAYTAGLLAGRYYLPAGIDFVVAAVVGGVIAFLVGLPALRLRGLYLAITTIGFTVLMENTVFRLHWLSRGSAGLTAPRPYIGSFGFIREADYLSIVLLVLLLLWLIDANVVRTRLGRAFHGIKENEEVAQSFGVDVARYKLLAFVLSGAMAGLAGALYGHFLGVVSSDTFGFQNVSLLLVALVVIGGLGSRAGVVAAAVIFSIIPRFFEVFTGWDLLIGSAALIYAVARHPGGLAEAIHEARTARAAKEAREGDDDDIEDASIPKLPDFGRPTGVPEHAPVAPGSALLVATDVKVRFGGLMAVDVASITVPAGKIVGLIGPNGAGKSTLFNAVSGFVSMESGAIQYRGQRIDGLPPHARAQLGIGRTFQHIGLARNLSVLENLLLAQHQLATYDIGSALAYLPAAGNREAELLQRSREILAALGFEDFADKPVKHLSGGQMRIVELACALSTGPELLMLDEPSAGMSPAAVENLAERLRDLRDELGRTVLLIEHHVPLVLDVCDEVYVLNFGQILASGPPAEVASREDVVSAYLGDDSFTAGGAAPRRRRRRNVEVPA
jgi:branched-chain amino acid transport system permease protein